MSVPERAHPELAAEQAYIERAYERLDEMQREAEELALAAMAQQTRSFQGQYERDVFTRVGLHRREQLDIGDESLCFGRIDHVAGERYYVGRRGVLDEDRSPLVIDWRVPAAAPFYRATGRDPMGLRLRRHLLARGRTLLAIEDEEFVGERGELGLSGLGALVAALERPRAGTMRDIVATVQAEQDEIIRSEVPGILAVQGGPGTGKTAVALHRAAYLLFTHRKRLERQGVLIVGPNRLFLRYIDQVLPALGETGAQLATLSDLVPGVRIDGADRPEAERVKGDVRMARVLSRAVGLHQRAPHEDAVVRYERHDLVVRRARLDQLVRIAKRSRHPHNRRRAMLHSILVKEVFRAYVRAERTVDPLLPVTLDKRAVVAELRAHPAVVAALDAIWPALTPEGLLRDLFASRELLEQAAGRMLKPAERAALARPRDAGLTAADIPLLDEVATRIGPTKVLGRRLNKPEDDELDTFGHVLVDEVQDLSPMALRMIARRSRSGWMTIVGDLAQSVGAWTPPTWDAIVAHLRPRSGWERRELTINYRTPAEIMALAERVRRVTAPNLRPANAVREAGAEPTVERVAPGSLERATARTVRRELEAIGEGTVVVIAPGSMLGSLSDAIGVDAIRAHDPDARLGARVTLADADVVKGLEFDAVVLVEPAVLVDEHAQGLRALYVALTRATRRLAIVHAEPLPRVLT